MRAKMVFLFVRHDQPVNAHGHQPGGATARRGNTFHLAKPRPHGAIQNGAMWARFGQVECLSAPRRRTAGLVAVGIDRLVVPDGKEKLFVPGKKFLRKESKVWTK